MSELRVVGDRVVRGRNRTVYCDNPYCQSPAAKIVRVSVDRAGDEQRAYCAVCEEVFSSGVQHGRYVEAAARGSVPDFQAEEP